MDELLLREAGLRILVAEDEPLAAMVIEDALIASGHSVALAPDGEAAWRLATTGRFDVLVTDLAMPRLTGWELIGRLRAQRPDLPVVVMTGYLPPNGRNLLLSHPGDPPTLLLKPFELGELLAAVERATPPCPAAPSQPPAPAAEALLELH